MIAKFTKEYENLTPDQQDARDIREMKDMFDKIQKAFAEALVEASDNFQAAQAQKNTTEEGGVKHQARENTDIPYILYRKLLSKKSIKATRKDWAKVSDARVTEYRGLSDNEIPDVDFLEIAEYNIVDKGYVYTIRNYDKNSFEIIGKNRIKNRYDGYVMEVSNNGETSQGNSSRDAEKGSDSEGHTDSNRVSGHQGTLRENAGRSEESKDLEPFYSVKSGNTNNGQRTVNDSAQVKLSDRDSNDNQLTVEQQKYFKDSVVRDANGNLLVVYHGTRKADFTVFKRNVTYFTDNKEMADSYSPNGDMYEGYVNITKPYEIDAAGEKWSKIPIDDATKKFLQEYGAGVFKEGGKWRTSPADIVSAIEEAVENGDMDYDGIIIKNIDDTGSYYKDKDNHVATDYIVFNSKQFKNVDNKTPTSDPDIRYSYRGVNKDGIEVYETSGDIKKLSYKDRQQRFLDIMANDYRGRTAKFIRNGHTYYATFEEKDVNKNIYGDKRSDKKGYKAKINVGADGDIFELVENAKYNGSLPEKGKKISAHRGVGYWDYFIKNVQIDGIVFNLTANVRKKADGAFVYSIQLNENKKIKASPPLGLLSKALNGVTNASNKRITQPAPKVNSQNSGTNSERGEDTSNRSLLANAFEGLSKSSIEYQMIQDYREQIKVLNLLDEQLSDLNAQIHEIRFTKGKYDAKKLQKLEEKAERMARDINKQDMSS